MEKSATKQRRKYSRLLKFFALSLLLLSKNCLFAQTKTEAFVESYSTACKKGDQLIFLLVVPDKSPSIVSHTLGKLPQGVSLVSARKEPYQSPDLPYKSNTSIEFIFQFSKVGTVILPEITLKTGLKRTQIKMPQITVDEDPNIAESYVFFAENTKNIKTSCGEKTELNIYGRFIQEVTAINIALNEDFIIEKKQNQSETLQEESISLNGAHLFSFFITPLKTGNFVLDEISILVLGTNNKKQVLKVPEISFSVTGQTENSQQDTEDLSFLDNAFSLSSNQTQSEKNEEKSKDVNISFEKFSTEEKIETAKKIAILRSNEKYSKEHKQAKKERIQFEKSIGIENAQNEYKSQRFFMILCFSLLLLIISIVFLALFCGTKNHKKIFLIVSIFILSFSIGIFISNQNQFTAKYAIFVGGEVKNIPDETSSIVGNLSCGTRLKVEKETDLWIFVKQGKTFSGWVLKKDLFFIEKTN